MTGPRITLLHRSARAAARSALERGCKVLDLTSQGEDPWFRFSPFFPHGSIPIPLWPGRTAASVEGIWQGLKRFEREDQIDPQSFENRSLRGLKRTSRAKGVRGTPRGRVLGHQAGSHEATLLRYVDARRQIYLPAYRWVLEHRLQDEMKQLRVLVDRGPIVLLDYTVNGDVADETRPLSHASLVKAHLQGAWPDL